MRTEEHPGNNLVQKITLLHPVSPEIKDSQSILYNLEEIIAN